ncbi:hypothetical protein J2T08_006317 [Neorhizobium galegae]|uniref:hypothetical protein n=1 Tax=Neorhizobium galegae TaxID=399 RepID=UPI001AE65D01|nr:hypothetical protein [Neorhizobium galegae]MBP2562332.1 hypothetical protein [Neorhizobium galegae]MDQ0138372.1 hypothetical protein [Neorhizobium galegae]
MKLLTLTRRWRETRHHERAPLVSQVGYVRDKRHAVYEMVASGAADDPALFIIEEIERLSESIIREI